MDDAVEKDAIRCTQSIQIVELTEIIAQLKVDIEIITSEFLVEKTTIIAEKENLEIVIDELNRKEAQRKEDDNVALMRSMNTASESAKNVSTETFSEFLKKKNEIEGVLEEQKIQKINNEYLLEQQKLVLGETIRLLLTSAEEVSRRKAEREREKEIEKAKEKEKVIEKQRMSLVDININESVTEQLRCVNY